MILLLMTSATFPEHAQSHQALLYQLNQRHLRLQESPPVPVSIWLRYWYIFSGFGGQDVCEVVLGLYTVKLAVDGNFLSMLIQIKNLRT